MPIELKWVRQDPDTVRKWQIARGRCPNIVGNDGNDNTLDAVDIVVQSDQASRHHLQTLEDLKRRLNVVQRKLRPLCRNSEDHTENNQDESSTIEKEKRELLDERKTLKASIEQQETNWKKACQKTNQALWSLASPIDLDDGMNDNDANITENGNTLKICHDTTVSLPEFIESPIKDDRIKQCTKDSSTRQLYMNYTSNIFRHYPMFQVPFTKILVDENPTTTSLDASQCVINPDRALELWGSITTSTTIHHQNNNIVDLPVWLRLITNLKSASMKSKLIWGDKQLPVCASIWGKENSSSDIDNVDGSPSSTTVPTKKRLPSCSFDLVALTASSVFDARRIRDTMVGELLDYYSALLEDLDPTNRSSNTETVIQQQHQQHRIDPRLSIRRIHPTELECHEWSRVEIWISHATIDSSSQDSSSSSSSSPLSFRLGSVSHWGDAISRTTNMIFASGAQSGGTNKKEKMMRNKSTVNVKEYVHIVQASVVKDDTFEKLIYGLQIPSSVGEEDHMMLDPIRSGLFRKVNTSDGIMDIPQLSDAGSTTARSIFGQLKTANTDVNNDSKAEPSDPSQTCTRKIERNNPDSLTDMFWREDVWTDEDEKNAQMILARNVGKCTISSMIPTIDASISSDQNASAWDLFYQTHQTRFFKDRHYLSKSFPIEFGYISDDGSAEGVISTAGKTLVELGCGVGNAILPLLEAGVDNSQWNVIHGIDISPEAIRLLSTDPRFIAFNTVAETGVSRNSFKRAAYAHVCDLSQGTLPSLCVGVADVTTMLFCLSAIDPDFMPTAISAACSSLKPGGRLLFRDYGRFDEAQMKLGTSRSKLVKENFYRKSDGTKCYYFSLEDLDRLFVQHGGMKIVEVNYLRRAYPNKATGQERRRVWVQGRFEKPIQ